MAPQTTHDTDILILGSGGAGLFAALHAHKAASELSITVAVKGLLGKCGCTRMVQGGYNVALAKEDSVERHFMDTIDGGRWLPDQELAWQLVTLAVERVHELENEIGCFFDRNPDGTVHQKAFAGQTFDRTVHKGDLTGIEIVNRLAEQLWRREVRRLEDHRALDLIPAADGSGLAGVYMLDMRTGEPLMVRARATLLGTGGGPTMYLYHTPSGDKSCDGMAMALRAGLPLRDMEMVQFHPTGLLAGPGTRMTGTVLEEGLRGSGGYLLDETGARFMFDYDPRGERATRDIVCRGVADRIRQGHAPPNGGLDTSTGHRGPDNAARLRGSKPLADPAQAAIEAAHQRAYAPLGRRRSDLESVRRRLYQVMWDDVGILRTAEGLARARHELNNLATTISLMGVADS